MKVELIIDESLDESLVKIYAPSYNEDIENIKRSLETTNINMLVAFKRLNKNKFIKISRYEIINLDYVKKLDLSFKGTIAVEFKNGSISYVSRRYLKEFKKALGF